MENEVKEQKPKKKADKVKIGAVIILVISALVFIPTGGTAVISSILQKNKTPVFGKYKGQKIEYKAGSDFAASAANLAQAYQNYGYDVSQISSYIFQNAFEGTVQNMYYKDAVEASGYSVPKSAVNRAILPYFRDANGDYSQKLYNQTSESEKSDLRSAAEKSLIYSRFEEDLFGSNKLYGLKVSSKESNFIANMGTEKHGFQLATFSTGDLPREEAVKYAEKNMETFKRFNISAVTLSEKLDADNTLKQIQNGEITFDQAVTDISEKLYTGDDGKLSSPYYYQLKNTIPVEENLLKVIGLANGAISEVIQTSRGYSIFRCDGDSLAADLTDESTVDTVLSYIKAYEMSYIENYYTDVANKFVYEVSTLSPITIDISDGEEGRILDPNNRVDQRLIAAGGENIVELTPFEVACRNNGMKAVDVPAFPVNYGNSSFFDTVPTDVTELSALSSNNSAFKTLFALKENELSQPFVLGSNVVVAKCVSIQKDDATADENYTSQAAYYDQDSASAAIMASPDLENNFFDTYYKFFLNQ